MREEKRWSQEEEQFLKDHYKMMSYCDIGKQLGRAESAIRAKCFDLGLVKHDRWTQEELDFISENAAIMSYKAMATYLNRSQSAVQIKAHRYLNIKKSPYCCDYHYFEKIDTEEKAYWLGFIYADGYITINHETNSGTVGIELQNQDIEHLKKFNASIHGNYKITTREKTCPLSKDADKIFLMSSIRIYSKAMVDDLLKWGVDEQKSYTMQCPNLSDEMMRHFLRGYFDGDGCITYNHVKSHTYIRCAMDSCTLSFLIALRTFLYQKCNICSSILETFTTYRLVINSDMYSQMFLQYIYEDAHIYLDRKYQKYQRIKTNDSLWASSRRNERIQMKSGEENGKAEMPIRMEGCE